MKMTVNHPTYGEIVYAEGFWLGKKTLTVNGVEAAAVSKREFIINGKHATLKGSFFSGASLCIDGESIEVCPKLKWYEISLVVALFGILFVWSNVPALCAIFPVVGGAIGGGLCGALGASTLCFMKSVRNPLYKILIGFGMFALTTLILFAIASIFLAAAAV